MMFNNGNDNYLPDLNHFSPVGVDTHVTANHFHAPSNAVIPDVSGQHLPQHFSFFVPTQNTSVPTWIPPGVATGVSSAPGLGANWQHAIPSSWLWAHHTPHFLATTTPTPPAYSSVRCVGLHVIFPLIYLECLGSLLHVLFNRCLQLLTQLNANNIRYV